MSSSLEDKFSEAWKVRRPWLPEPVKQYPFVARECGVGEGEPYKSAEALEKIRAKERELHITLPNFVADFAWPQYKVAVEMDGLAPGHMAFTGWVRDQVKGNRYGLFGWTLFRFCTLDMQDKRVEEAMTVVTAGLAAAGCPIDKPAADLVESINRMLGN